jgi:hypothetical protein
MPGVGEACLKWALEARQQDPANQSVAAVTHDSRSQKARL